jgi:N-acetylneuraminate synthase/N,N'-diacetyllegionaminate synthase
VIHSADHGFAERFSIAGRVVGGGSACFVVAEAGVAHFGDLERAFELVEMAVEAGADAVKFQIFKTEALVSSSDLEWTTRMRSRELPPEAFVRIRDRCRERGIIFFATAHDPESLEVLAGLDPPVYKIGSGEVRNPHFFAAVARQGKPVIFSTGMYRQEDIEPTLGTLAENGCREVAVLHCVTRYPTPPEEANLRRMARLRERFPGPVGYSDHCATPDIALAAVALGAEVIEKHITLEKNVPDAQDWRVACDRRELVDFVRAVRRIEAALGSGDLSAGPVETEQSTWARKSIVAARRLDAGTVIDRQHLAFKRPGRGLGPDKVGELLGRRLRVSLEADALVLPDHLESQRIDR